MSTAFHLITTEASRELNSNIKRQALPYYAKPTLSHLDRAHGLAAVNNSLVGWLKNSGPKSSFVWHSYSKTAPNEESDKNDKHEQVLLRA